MKFFGILFVLCLIFMKSQAADSSNTHHKDHCPRLLSVFSVRTGLFFQCTIRHSQPITYCSKCVEQFYDLTQTYHNLTTFIDGTNCRDRYFDLDRINVIETTYIQAWDLWNRGFCSDCYYWPDSMEKPVLSNTTKDFFHFQEDWFNCTNTFYGTACINCLGKYSHLNVYYIDYQKSRMSKVCYDMQDQINKTRLFWSKEMSCCKDKKSSLFSFTLWSSAFCLIVPFMFYGGFIWTTIQNERTGFISADDREQPAVQETTGNRSAREAPDTDSTYIDILKKQSKQDESDDEIVGYSPKKKSKLVDMKKKKNEDAFDDVAGPSKSNLTNSDDNKINKKPKTLKQPSSAVPRKNSLIEL